MELLLVLLIVALLAVSTVVSGSTREETVVVIPTTRPAESGLGCLYVLVLAIGAFLAVLVLAGGGLP